MTLINVAPLRSRGLCVNVLRAPIPPVDSLDVPLKAR
ncbi:hypothetical protein ABIF81_001930 [Bradyrhizobium daqingense]